MFKSLFLIALIFTCVFAGHNRPQRAARVAAHAAAPHRAAAVHHAAPVHHEAAPVHHEAAHKAVTHEATHKAATHEATHKAATHEATHKAATHEGAHKVAKVAGKTEGIDISSYQGTPSQEAFDCFKKSGKEFIIVQIWEGGYGINQDFVENYHKAAAAGFESIDAYAFACNNCANNKPETICSDIKNTLPSGFNGRVWLDIEGCSGCWTGSAEEKLQFLEDTASTCESKGLSMGVYSGEGSWGAVFGSASFPGGKLTSLPMWYSFYNGVAGLGDYSDVRFGGFESAMRKQYRGTGSLCGISVDLDYQ